MQKTVLPVRKKCDEKWQRHDAKDCFTCPLPIYNYCGSTSPADDLKGVPGAPGPVVAQSLVIIRLHTRELHAFSPATINTTVTTPQPHQTQPSELHNHTKHNHQNFPRGQDETCSDKRRLDNGFTVALKLEERAGGKHTLEKSMRHVQLAEPCVTAVSTK